MDELPGDGQPDASIEWALRERTKEITALLEVSRLAHAAQNEHDLLTSVLPAIPPGWQYPEATAARLEIGTVAAQTPNYQPTPGSLTEPLVHEGLVLGRLTVACTPAAPAGNGGPFLPEERLLLRGLAEQITAALIRIRSQEELAYWADHDRQTGLLNRSAWSLEVARRTVEEPERPYAYVLVKASSLADINSTYGFAVGNRIVTELGSRIREHVGEMSSRDGARITFLRNDVPLDELRAYIQSEIVPVLNQPFEFTETAGLPIFLSSTVAAAHYPGHTRSAQAIAALAATALRRGTRGALGIVVADPVLDGVQRSAVDVLSLLRTAAERDEFRLHYQPKVDADGRMHGAEALLRWESGGLILPPSEFIAIAERGGVMRDVLLPLTLRMAFTQAAEWQRAGRRISVAVNLSPSSIVADDCVSIVLDELESAGLDPALAELEITEAAAVTDLVRTRTAVEAFRAAGIRVALDDFGTGYSSLALLRDLPIDVVKIDTTFVQRAPADPAAAVIVESIINMAHAVGAIVVGEGVEDADTARWLLERHVELLQGYYFSRPLPPDQVPTWRFAG